ncbi:MAG: hypothetical protein GY795_33830 [Desulfobacterales bacterium]|nr:hypothetical protein [Desulfobacterales bacterium]
MKFWQSLPCVLPKFHFGTPLKVSFFLVPRLCLGMHSVGLCPDLPVKRFCKSFRCGRQSQKRFAKSFYSLQLIFIIILRRAVTNLFDDLRVLSF